MGRVRGILRHYSGGALTADVRCKVMRPYAQAALERKLGLQAGVDEMDEIVAWADRTLLQHEYDEELAAVSLGASLGPKEMLSLLGRLTDGGDEWDAMRRVMGKMYCILMREPSCARSFARFLESFWLEHSCRVPHDMTFFWGIGDQFELAEQGVYGSVDEARKRLLEHLSTFKDNTEPGDRGERGCP